jgi:hypothetical protein
MSLSLRSPLAGKYTGDARLGSRLRQSEGVVRDDFPGRHVLCTFARGLVYVGLTDLSIAPL